MGCIRLYLVKEKTMTNKKIVICGYHGYSNSGDEALLKAMIDIIRRKYSNVDITVLSVHPESTGKLYGVNSVYRYNLIKIYKLFKSSDLFIFGGGSLLQDITSKRSLYYYLTILNMAIKSGIKIMLYGNGIGPLNHRISRRKTAKCLNKVDLITLRDDLSDKLLQEIGVNKPSIFITADPAFTLSFDDLSKNESLLLDAKIPKGKKYAVISVREWKNAVNNFVDVIAAFCDNLNEQYNVLPLFIPMQYKEDSEISKAVISKMKSDGYIIQRPLEVDEIFSLIGFSTVTLGMRLHTLIYATTLGVPCIAVSYDPKVTAFMQSIHQPLCIDAEKMNADSLIALLQKMMSELPEMRNDIRKSLEYLREKAESNADLAIELLKK